MATYYVRPDGNNSNTGLGSGTSTAWQTLAKALGASGIGSGDTLYIAPGTYTESVTIGGTYTAPTYVYGDPLCQQFTGISAGSVWHSSATSTGNDRIINAVLLSGSGKSNLNFRNIHWLSCNGYNQVSLLLGQNNTFTKCVFEQVYWGAPQNVNNSSPSTLAINTVFDSCIFLTPAGGNGSIVLTGNNVADTSVVKNCLFIGSGTFHCVLLISAQCEITNCSFHNFNIGVGVSTGSATFVSLVKNCVFARCNSAVTSVTLGWVTATYNRLCLSSLSNVPTSVTNITEGVSGLDTGYALLTGLQNLQFFSSYLGSPNTSAGIATGAPVTDMYGVTWTGTTPDTGSATYRNLSSVSTYLPSERNASTITIAPGSTSQSIELYLGVTGLTASTAGLSARYNRTRTASVNIPLVTRTIGQAWISGGFAEVDAVNMPGIYRVDIPDAALAAGADDVTLVVRGAAGTNGAVMTVKLSSGGLTSAQTASAVWGAAVAGYGTATDFGGVVNETRNVVGSTETLVQGLPQTIWDEPYTTHTAANTFGARVLKTTVDNRLVDVGTSQHIHANVHAIVDSTVAAAELSGALLHNGTDYISADLLSPTSPATLLRMGPYSVVADQAKQEINIDILNGSSLPVVLQLVDVTGTGIPLVGATLSVKIYNAAGTLVTTYTGTASYSDAGFLTFTLDSVVTATPGTYYLTVTRTTGATDTSIYGGLRLYVRSN